MKTHRILALSASVLMPFVALAKLPLSNDAFGKTEATFDFCAQQNAQDAAKYQERKQQMFRDVPEQELADARGTQEYQDGYRGMSDQLRVVPQQQAVQTCQAYLEGK